MAARIRLPRPEGEPPKGPPWDASCEEVPWVFLDLEMTGLDPQRDRVLEICAHRVRGGVVEASVSTLVRPDAAIHGNTAVHGIREEDLVAAPFFRELTPSILALLEGAILVAHAAEWDVAFLEAELARAGVAYSVGFYLDTLVLARRALLAPSYALGALCKELGIDPGRAHRAEADVRSLRAIFQRITAALSAKTPRELWHVRVGKRFARPEILARAADAAASQAPVLLRYRPSRKPPEDFLFRVMAVRSDLDPPQVLGYQLESRSRRELRADRILAIEKVSAEPTPATGRER